MPKRQETCQRGVLRMVNKLTSRSLRPFRLILYCCKGNGVKRRQSALSIDHNRNSAMVMVPAGTAPFGVLARRRREAPSRLCKL